MNEGPLILLSCFASTEFHPFSEELEQQELDLQVVWLQKATVDQYLLLT